MSIAKSQYPDSSDHQEYKSQPTTLPQAATQIDQPIQARFEPQNIFLSLVAFRLLNALTIKTFFQPDEYYQALEPAWKWTFGDQAGAWITWVCRLSRPFHESEVLTATNRNGKNICDLLYTLAYSL